MNHLATRSLFLVCALAAALAACNTGDDKPAAGGNYAKDFQIVYVDAAASPATQLAVHACAGLHNRKLGGSVFVGADPKVPQTRIDGAVSEDEAWLTQLNLTASSTVDTTTFLNECVETFGGCVRYTYAKQHEILPAILTTAAALGVPPLDDGAKVTCKAPTLDATQVFQDKTTQYLSTKYAYENYLHQTTGLAMLNPGYEHETEDLAHPALVDDMPPALIDFVFERKLFVTFLVNGCIDGNPEKTLLSAIVNESGWPTPVGVYGYNDSWLQGGYLYEAQTRCLDSANMGAIPTRTTNLSFFDTRRPAITRAGELAHNPPEEITYDKSKTYVAFVVGDGDNIRYMMTTRKDWLQQRTKQCRGATPKCPPLNWTISPHLPDIAPDVLQWYFEAAASTGADYFILPPSGYQYAYPSMLGDADEANFVAKTEAAARIYASHSTVHWEWFQSWRDAVQGIIPRYAHAGGQIRGVFPVNVPYLFEAFTWWPAGQMVDVITGDDGGAVALFRPQSWRGVDDRDDYHLTPQHMADKLAAFPKGTVTWVYMTSDGGLSLDNSYFELIKVLPAHVQIVSTDAAAELAIRAAGK